MNDVQQTVLKAIELNKRVKIIYQGEKGFSERVVRPFKIENGELHAYCYLRKANRKFRMTNILSAVAESGDKTSRRESGF